MAISFDSRVAVADSVLFHDVRGETMFLNSNSEHYFGLDEIGSQMFRVLNNAPSVQSAFVTLLDEFDVDAEQLRVDLQELINKLVDAGLVEITNE